MNYLDLFSGCGGFRRGLEEAGFTFEWEGHSEIDKYASSVYERHYPQSEVLGDVNDVRANELPRIDLVTFGSPCQDLSIAGKGRGLDGQRSSLFFRAIEIIGITKPKVFIWENVKGALSSNGGKDFYRVLRAIADLGIYDIEWQLLNTRWFLPQNRERIYLVGHLRGTGGFKVFPIRKGNGNLEKSGKQPEGGLFSQCIDSNYYKGADGKRTMIQVGTLRNRKEGRGFRSVKEEISPTLNARGREDGDMQTVIAMPLKFLDRNQNNYQGDYSFTVDSCNTGGIKDEQGIRRLTPVECERLQGFEDDWTRWGKNGEEISDSQRYKMIGNAVSVPVVKAVATRLAR